MSGKTYREHLNDTLKEGVPDWAAELLNELEGAAAFEAARTGGGSDTLTDSGPKGGGGSVSIPGAGSGRDDSASARSSDSTAETEKGSRPSWGRK